MERFLVSPKGSITAFVFAADGFDESAHERDEKGRFSVTGASGKVSGSGKERTVTFVDAKGKPLPGKVQQRLKALGIPPAWKNIRLNDDPNAALQVKGVDAKGREQSRYSLAHTDKAAAAKFARVKELNEKIGKIEKAIAADAKKGDPTALAARAIQLTGLRPGSTKETGADKKAFGITTITGKHVSVKGDAVTFRFPGKSGKLNEKTINDRILATYVKTKVGSKETVFPTNGNKVGLYLKKVAGAGFKTKDFRTWQGTAKAVEALGGRVAKTAAAFKSLQKEVATAVAEHLGNTPAVALKSYISPLVWEKARAF